MAAPLLTKKIVKKRTKHFKRPQSDRKISVKTNWRRPKGIDSRVRRKFKGCTLMPNIGYGTDKKTRHYLPNGFKKFVVHNAKELELLMMHNRYKSLIHKCALSTSPSSSSDYTVMVIYEQDLRYLAYCRAGDKTWTTVYSGQTMFHDVVYYKEKFYAINSFNDIHVCDVRSDINLTVTQQVGNIPGELSKLKPERLYMVESEGALLVVMGRKNYSDHSSWVFSVDLSTNTWTEIKDLGKRSLFLSQNSSVSIEISFDDNYCKSNCIYFVQDCAESGFYGRKVEGGKELKVYNMQDGKVNIIFHLCDLATNCQILIVACALTQETHHIVNHKAIDALGPNGILINIGQGAYVNEPELVSALLAGRLAGTGLDVYENELEVPEQLLGLDNVVLLPHVGSNIEETSKAIADLVIRNFEAYFGNKPLLTPVL
ncbi:hypothetical protein EZV62_027098 [Acer yangbiense]|uniref:DUF295 domain-containing protein n=1 Tax=Acer yangbiense TaxID=1000413 RepID=A0A5C7GSQ8_9ROSI|nr:hypothetical protein EZV62_027098 [Acer yangbiense]